MHRPVIVDSLSLNNFCADGEYPSNFIVETCVDRRFKLKVITRFSQFKEKSITIKNTTDEEVGAFAKYKVSLLNNIDNDVVWYQKPTEFHYALGMIITVWSGGKINPWADKWPFLAIFSFNINFLDEVFEMF